MLEVLKALKVLEGVRCVLRAANDVRYVLKVLEVVNGVRHVLRQVLEGERRVLLCMLEALGG